MWFYLNNPIDLNTDTGHRFVVDCTRAGEGLITDKELQQKYELSPADWQNITKDMALGRAVRAERERRMLDGTAARESAASYFVKGADNSRSDHDRRAVEPTAQDRSHQGTAGNRRHRQRPIVHGKPNGS